MSATLTLCGEATPYAIRLHTAHAIDAWDLLGQKLRDGASLLLL